jgi:hypothetical protein
MRYFLFCLAATISLVTVSFLPAQETQSSANQAAAAAATQRYDAYKAQVEAVAKAQKDVDDLTNSLFPSGKNSDFTLWGWKQYGQYFRELPSLKEKLDREQADLRRLGEDWDRDYASILAPISKLGETIEVTFFDKSVDPPVYKKKTMEYIPGRIEIVWGAKDEKPEDTSILPEGEFEVAIDLDGMPQIGQTIKATARFSKMGKLPEGDPPLWSWTVTGDLDKVAEAKKEVQVKVRGEGVLKVRSDWIGPFGKWHSLGSAQITIRPEFKSPIIGTWEGRPPYSEEPLLLIVEREQGKNIVGLLVMGDRMPFKGVWDEANKVWGIHLAPMPDSPEARRLMESPQFTQGSPFTSLKPISEKQLQLFAPPCTLTKKK